MYRTWTTLHKHCPVQEGYERVHITCLQFAIKSTIFRTSLFHWFQGIESWSHKKYALQRENKKKNIPKIVHLYRKVDVTSPPMLWHSFLYTLALLGTSEDKNYLLIQSTFSKVILQVRANFWHSHSYWKVNMTRQKCLQPHPGVPMPRSILLHIAMRLRSQRGEHTHIIPLQSCQPPVQPWLLL